MIGFSHEDPETRRIHKNTYQGHWKASFRVMNEGIKCVCRPTQTLVDYTHNQAVKPIKKLVGVDLGTFVFLRIL